VGGAATQPLTHSATLPEWLTQHSGTQPFCQCGWTQPLSHSAGAATLPKWLELSHSATLPKWLEQPLSHSAKVAGAAPQPLSHSAKVAGAATPPLSRSARVAEWLAGVKISAIAR